MERRRRRSKRGPNCVIPPTPVRKKSEFERERCVCMYRLYKRRRMDGRRCQPSAGVSLRWSVVGRRNR